MAKTSVGLNIVYFQRKWISKAKMRHKPYPKTSVNLCILMSSSVWTAPCLLITYIISLNVLIYILFTFRFLTLGGDNEYVNPYIPKQSPGGD